MAVGVGIVAAIRRTPSSVLRRVRSVRQSTYSRLRKLRMLSPSPGPPGAADPVRVQSNAHSRALKMPPRRPKSSPFGGTSSSKSRGSVRTFRRSRVAVVWSTLEILVFGTRKESSCHFSHSLGDLGSRSEAIRWPSDADRFRRPNCNISPHYFGFPYGPRTHPHAPSS